MNFEALHQIDLLNQYISTYKGLEEAQHALDILSAIAGFASGAFEFSIAEEGFDGVTDMANGLLNGVTSSLSIVQSEDPYVQQCQAQVRI